MAGSAITGWAMIPRGARPRQVAAVFDRAAKEIGYIEAFVSNAGIIHKASPLADMAVEEIKRVIDVDLTAHLVSLREAVRRMGKSRGGKGGAIVTRSEERRVGKGCSSRWSSDQ